MAKNKGKSDQLHDLLPKHLNSKGNVNWKALVEAFGEQDQNISDLVTEVRKQFFIKTSSRPYLDRLAANNKISRPRLVGMDDPSFRQYIPILSYQPKQVKLIIDKLLDIFFFKESTTAFITAQGFSPFDFNDGWELEILVDEQYTDRIVFRSADFTDIHSATAEETVAAFNRQAKYCYATTHYDSITKNTYIRVFTNTVGSKGSLRIKGGRIDVALKFNGFISTAGNGSNTQWSVSKIGDETTFQNIGGAAPGLNYVEPGNIVIIDIPNNSGSFEIKSVDLVTNTIKFTNLFSTPGTYTQTSSDQVKFIKSEKYVAYLNPRRAITWETSPSEVLVEMPTSPPVVKRSLIGSFHTNGVFSQMSNRIDDNTIEVVDAFEFPESGSFILEEQQEIFTRMLTPTEDETISKKNSSRLQYSNVKYSYDSRVELDAFGDIVEGQTQITNLTSTTGLSVGQQVLMTGVPKYARVVSVSGSTANISFPATSTSTAVQVKFLGNTLYGLSPALPMAASLNQYQLASISRTSNVVTATTIDPHNYSIGEPIIISECEGVPVVSTTGDVSYLSNQITNVSSMSNIAPGMVVVGTGIPSGTLVVSVASNSFTISNFATSTGVAETLNLNENLNGVYTITDTTSNSVEFVKIGSDGSALVPGYSRIERIGLSNSGSKVIVFKAVSSEVSRINGSHMWDLASPFVLSSSAATILEPIQAGKIVRLLSTTSNEMPSEGGYVIFDYGRETQEGPVRYLYKPTDNTLAIDPSYTFKHSHATDSPVIAISRKGPHQMSSKGLEYPAYITDPSEARIILQDLIRSVKSAGIFVNFLVRYPEQLYATLDVYQSGNDPG